MTDKSLREDAPGLWAEIIAWCRDIGIDWPEDDIAAVIGKVISPTPDRIPDDIDRVMAWCRAAEKSGDDEAEATVEVWRQTPRDLIEITVGDDGAVSHRIAPGVEVEMKP